MSLAPALCASEDDYVISFADIDINMDREVATRGGMRVSLTRSEFELLKLFLVNQRRDLSRDAILRAVWGNLAEPNTRTVDAHVMRLRHKLEPEPDSPRHFITVHRIGYRFQP